MAHDLPILSLSQLAFRQHGFLRPFLSSMYNTGNSDIKSGKLLFPDKNLCQPKLPIIFFHSLLPQWLGVPLRRSIDYWPVTSPALAKIKSRRYQQCFCLRIYPTYLNTGCKKRLHRKPLGILCLYYLQSRIGSYLCTPFRPEYG